MTNNYGSMENYYNMVKKYLPGGVHYNFNLPWEERPLFFKDTRDSRVIDIDGNEYLDLYARFGAMILGHKNKEYIEAIKESIDRVFCVSHSLYDEVVLEKIVNIIPSAEMVRFGLSGTEMVQNAIRLARAYTRRDKFIRFINHYHGNADNIMGGKQDKITSHPRDYRGDFKGTLGREEGVFEHSYLLPWNDIDVITEFLADHHEEVAAIITEPICVNGGSIMPADGYLEAIRALCDKYGIVLIFDEIITGFRTSVGGAQTLFNVTPDLTILGKAIAGGGVPVSAIAGKEKIMKYYVSKKVVHAGTFNGYPTGMAAIHATLNILSRDNCAALNNMNRKVTEIHKILLDEAKSCGIPMIVQGHPSCGAFHCCDEVLTTPSDYSIQIMSLDIIINAYLQKHGILISSVSRIYPNISLNDSDIDWFGEHCRPALKEASEIIQEML